MKRTYPKPKLMTDQERELFRKQQEKNKKCGK